jgi:hypothetical protein
LAPGVHEVDLKLHVILLCRNEFHDFQVHDHLLVYDFSWNFEILNLLRAELVPEIVRFFHFYVTFLVDEFCHFDLIGKVICRVCKIWLLIFIRRVNLFFLHRHVILLVLLLVLIYLLRLLQHFLGLVAGLLLIHLVVELSEHFSLCRSASFFAEFWRAVISMVNLGSTLLVT